MVAPALLVGWLLSGWSWWSARRDTGGHCFGPECRQSPPWVAAPIELGPVLVVAIAMSMVAVALRHRAPRVTFAAASAAALAISLSGLVGPLVLLAPAWCLAVLARRTALREWVLWSLLMIPALLAPGVRSAGWASATTWSWLMLGWLVLLVPGLMARLRAERAHARSRARREELRRAAAEERVRVSRDIHDVVGHSLSMISLQAGVALHLLDRDPRQVRSSLEAIRRGSVEALAEVRQTLGVLEGGADLEPTATLERLPALVEPLRLAGHPVQLTGSASEAVPLAIQQVAYRIVQEALTNVVRHAPGAAVEVALDTAAGWLTVSVTDDGPGGPITEGGGLRGMRARVAAVGGRLDLGPGPRGGFTVTARLPIGAVRIDDAEAGRINHAEAGDD